MEYWEARGCPYQRCACNLQIKCDERSSVGKCEEETCKNWFQSDVGDMHNCKNAFINNLDSCGEQYNCRSGYQTSDYVCEEEQQSCPSWYQSDVRECITVTPCSHVHVLPYTGSPQPIAEWHSSLTGSGNIL